MLLIMLLTIHCFLSILMDAISYNHIYTCILRMVAVFIVSLSLTHHLQPFYFTLSSWYYSRYELHTFVTRSIIHTLCLLPFACCDIAIHVIHTALDSIYIFKVCTPSKYKYCYILRCYCYYYCHYLKIDINIEHFPIKCTLNKWLAIRIKFILFCIEFSSYHVKNKALVELMVKLCQRYTHRNRISYTVKTKICIQFDFWLNKISIAELCIF